jgi:hypothetical protein
LIASRIESSSSTIEILAPSATVLFSPICLYSTTMADRRLSKIFQLASVCRLLLKPGPILPRR